MQHAPQPSPFVHSTLGTGTDTGGTAGLTFDIDNRFITGEYIALNGRHFNATFGFL